MNSVGTPDPGKRHKPQQIFGGNVSKQIDIEDLNIFYGDFRAVEGVSMTIEPKSVTAFIGPSG